MTELIKQAKERGYKAGVKLKNATIPLNLTDEFTYNAPHLELNGVVIYTLGEWAEIVEPKEVNQDPKFVELSLADRVIETTVNTIMLDNRYNNNAAFFIDRARRKLRGEDVNVFEGVNDPKNKIQPKELTYEDVEKLLILNGSDVNNGLFTCYSQKHYDKLQAINKLLNVAKFLNDFSDEKEGYCFIILDNKLVITCLSLDTISMNILFSSYKTAQKALQILGEETIRLALSTDY